MCKCDRCNTELDYVDSRCRRTLKGGLNAKLCDKCANEWSELVLNGELAKRDYELTAQEEFLGSLVHTTPAPVVVWEKIANDRLQLHRDFLAESQKFINQESEPESDL